MVAVAVLASAVWRVAEPSKGQDPGRCPYLVVSRDVMVTADDRKSWLRPPGRRLDPESGLPVEPRERRSVAAEDLAGLLPPDARLDLFGHFVTLEWDPSSGAWTVRIPVGTQPVCRE